MKSMRSRSRGSTLVEIPIAIWMLFVLLVIPLLDLLAIGLRSTFVLSAVKDAVHAASGAQTFTADVSSTNLSAQHSAEEQARRSIGGFNGLSLISTQTSIIETNINTLTKVKHDNKLDAPADVSNFTYNLETTVVADVSPLVTFNSEWFGQIPGLTRPFRMTACSREFCEFPQGLDQ
jgi:hypothetical protein